MKHFSLVLASGSKPRAALLERHDYVFAQSPAGINEDEVAAETPEEYVGRVAMAKCEAVLKFWPGAIVLAADTTVVLGRRVLHKPETPFQAASMLSELRGQTCSVLTAVAIGHVSGGDPQLLGAIVESQVMFRDFQLRELQSYVATGEPIGKAGAFGLQGRGGDLVHTVRGCVNNVIGLPLCEVSRLLTALMETVNPDYTTYAHPRARCTSPDGRQCTRGTGI